MDAKNDQALKPSREQIIYANLLIIGVWLGIAVLVATYFIYVTGILPAYVDIGSLPQLWGQGVDAYLEATHSPHGWSWVSMLGQGDYLNYVGFALLALMTIICYLVLVKGYAAKKDWTYTAIAVLEILVLSVAASGILGAGGH